MAVAFASPAARKAGLRYERKVGEALRAVLPSNWPILSQYPLSSGFVDFAIFPPSHFPLLVECKASLSLEAFAQLARYARGVAGPCARVAICQRAGGRGSFPPEAQWLTSISALASAVLPPGIFILPWTGRFHSLEGV